jgi:hypothetical protein
VAMCQAKDPMQLGKKVTPSGDKMQVTRGAAHHGYVITNC